MSGPSSPSSTSPTSLPEPAWLTYARSYMGLQEVRDDSTLRGMFGQLGSYVASLFKMPGSAHTVPWCGAFVDSMLSKASIQTLPGSKALGALNWQFWGQPLKQPAIGAVAVFRRPGSGNGHVAFYVGEDSAAIHVLGGNQSDSVSITRMAKDRLVGYRWPSELPLPSGAKPVLLTLDGKPLSTNEA